MRLSAPSRAVSIRIGTLDVVRIDLRELEAGLARHHHVEDQQVEAHAAELGARGRRGVGGGDAIALAGEEARQQVADAAVVVDHQQVRRVVGGRDRNAATGAIIPPRSHGRGRRARSARAISFCTPSRPSASIMAIRKRRACSCASGPKLGERAGDPLGLQAGELHGERLALGGDEQQALAAVVLALLLHHVALVDELLEHAAERLLGDLQHVQQVGNLHAGVAIDEMQHPVVRPAEAELGQHVVRIADEIPVGEEQKLDDVPDRLGPEFGAPAEAALVGWRGVKFTSAILTYFGLIVTQRRDFTKGSYRRARFGGCLEPPREARSHGPVPKHIGT